ncbi:MAG: extracellular solute-binding protein [Clostridiales bacterium]|nr:extracellular solute-binding protein [Clostridiales bacterium]
MQQFFDGDTYDDNRWSRRIKDELNIDLEVAFSADITTDAYRNKVNALLATGELPDVMRWADINWFRQAYEADYLMDITDVFEQYATEPVKRYRELYPDCFEGASVDGRLYGFPYIDDKFHQAAYLWIRDDWLENTGSQPPKTIDEMIELARKFTFEDPDKDGVDDTYGLALHKQLVLSNYGTLLGFAGAFGVPGYNAAGVFYRGDDGKITYPYIQPGMKETLALVNQMYTEGLIDPEFITKDTSNMEADISEGKYGMMYHMNWGTWHPFNYSFQKDGVITRPYPIPTVPGREYKMGIESNRGGEIFVVSSQCENPEALIKILNLYNNIAIDFTDQEDFLQYWSDEQYRLCPIYIGIPTELHAPAIFQALEDGGATIEGVARQNYQYVLDFESGANRDSNTYGTWGQMNTQGDGGSMSIALNIYRPAGALVTNIMSTERPEIWLQNASVLQTLLETSFTDIITGAKPLDSFDIFVEEWLRAGGQQTLDELEQLYPNS